MRRTSKARSVSSTGKSPSAPATPPTLRRSKRNMASTASGTEDSSSVFDSPPPTAKKARRVKDKDSTSTITKAEVPAATLMSLNYDVQDKLLQYLDVQSLEALGQTCSHFDLMINGRYLTTLNLPFGEEILNDMKESKIFEKKPVLRLQCKSISQQDPFSLFVDSSYEVKKYVIEAQLSLLYLSKVRELDLVPDDIREAVNVRTSAMWDCGQAFDRALLHQLSAQGSLGNISRLNILLSREDISRNLWKDFMPAMVNLAELNVTVLERKAGAVQNEEYIYGYLEEIVFITRAKRLTLTILSENKRIKKLGKVLLSDHIQQLHISAPCTFSLVLVMKNLTEVTIEMSKPEGGSKDCCSYQGSRMDDRRIHRNGLCVINLGALFGRCPRLENFNGINIGKIPMFPTSHLSTKDKDKGPVNDFGKWSRKLKPLFHEEYLRNGGRFKEMKPWASKRWFFRQPSVPIEYGKNRLPSYMR